MCSFVGRCQVLVGVMLDARGADVARHVRQLVVGMPDTLGADEWRVAHHVLSRTVAQIAVMTGINRLPHIGRAAVAWDAAGPTNHQELSPKTFCTFAREFSPFAGRVCS